jgi:nucleoside-diphosphate-sugar epimerase
MNGVLITGGSGFIGTNLVQFYLGRGERILNLDILPPRNLAHEAFWKPVDILDKHSLKEALLSFSPRYVVHLAARTDLKETKRLEGYAANIEGVSNLIHALRSCKSVERCIYASSQLVCRVGYVPSGETDYAPNTLYGESKVQTEKIVREEAGGGVIWCLIRPTTVWGPWCSPHYQTFLELIRKGHYFHVGRKKLRKSYGFVGNFCHQVDALLAAPEGRIQGKMFYVADYEPLSLRDWAEVFRKEMGAPRIRTYPVSLAKMAAVGGDALNFLGVDGFPFNTFRLTNILTEYLFDFSDLKEIAPTLPFTIPEGVRMTVEWLRSNSEDVHC